MMKKMNRTLCLTLGLALVAGCAQQGTIMGRLSVPGEKTSTPVTMNWATTGFSSGGTMNVHLPAGETYTGKFLQVTSTTSADTLGGGGWGGVGWSGGYGGYGGYGGGWNDWGPYGSPWGGGGSYSTFVTNYSGKVIATLFGDKGNTMRCRFHLSQPASGMEGGGVGECEVKGGDKIAAQF
ncbi:MAG: hypothetical protein VCC00_04460 [Deltaproteobacteria bacterium]